MNSSSPKQSAWDRLRQLDAHPKTLDDFRVQTSSGAIVSLIALVVTMVLFFNQISHLVSTEKVEHMRVDDVKNATVSINIDITFPDLSCSAVNMGALDMSGETRKDVMHHVLKQSVDKNGKRIGQHETNKMDETLRHEEELLEHKRQTEETQDGTKKCGSCYGAGEEGQCCTTCQEVRDLYKKRGWQFDPVIVEQCSKEGFIEDLELNDGVGCNIYGFVVVPKVAGQIYFAPGKSFSHAHSLVKDVMSFTFDKFNNTHMIKTLSFGMPYPGATNPLDGFKRVLPEKEYGMYQYYAKIVPTEYHPIGGKPATVTNQFSVTDHFRHLSPTSRRGLPGVYFFYEFSPIRVTIEEQHRSFGHFLTNVCAIIGGVFTVMGMLDAALYSGLTWWDRRHNKGGIIGS